MRQHLIVFHVIAIFSITALVLLAIFIECLESRMRDILPGFIPSSIKILSSKIDTQQEL